MAAIFQGASAFTLTIITAMHEGYVTGVSQERAQELLGHYKKDGGQPLGYRHNACAVAAAVFVWLGWICVIESCARMFLSTKHAREQSTQEPQRKPPKQPQGSAQNITIEVGGALNAPISINGKRSNPDGPAAHARASLPPHEMSQNTATTESETRVGSAMSDFSTLASASKSTRTGSAYKTSSESGRSGKRLGDMSIAKLTSGVSDGGWGAM